MATPQPPERPASPARRGFLKAAWSILLGALAGLFPVASGVFVFLDPLRHKAAAGRFSRVASLEVLPNDGCPRKFTVVADRTDAWNRFPNVPIGAIYLRRTGDRTIEAVNAVCPHAGCFVDFVPARNGFFCPCHNSSFTPDGRINDPKSPSPRRLDALEVEIRNGTEIWVRFQNFRAGQAGKIPVA